MEIVTYLNSIFWGGWLLVYYYLVVFSIPSVLAFHRYGISRNSFAIYKQPVSTTKALVLSVHSALPLAVKSVPAVWSV